MGHLDSAASVFVVRSDSPFKSFEELVEYARKNPGMLKNAAGGLVNTASFNLEILLSKTNIKMNTIPFKSGGVAMVAHRRYFTSWMQK